MARTVTVKINGTEWHMPASYRASKEFAEQVGDPLKLAIQAESMTLELSTEDVVSAIYVGCKHAGSSLTKDQIGESIFESDSGLAGYLDAVGAYIAAMVAGSPERPTPASKKKPSRSRGQK